MHLCKSVNQEKYIRFLYKQNQRNRIFCAFGNRTNIRLSTRKTCTISNASTSTVLATESSDKGLIIINRPKALNALNVEMVRKINKHLRKWEKSKSLVIIKGAGDKSFSAGGDVRDVAKSFSTSLFREEYCTNALIGNYTIPYIALIDGISMGGGAGLAVHGKYRVATERTVFAMPETAIGLIPDAGGSYFLPRLQGKLGLYLGLTGYRLKGEDVLKAGVATHFCESAKLHALEEHLLNCSDANEVPNILEKFNNSLKQNFSLQPHMEQINKCFTADSIEQIIESLRKDGSNWAKNTLENLSKMSPTSLKITFQQLNLGANLSLQECLKMEYRIIFRLLKNCDFKEGVRALLIDKDQKPKWNPSTLEAISDERVQWFFRKLPDTEELKL